VPVDLRSRIRNISEDAGWTKKYVVLNNRTSINRDIVLDLDVVPDTDARSYMAVLPEVAVPADTDVLHDVTIVPDFCACTDFTRIVYI
jgi:hypothetical protein